MKKILIASSLLATTLSFANPQTLQQNLNQNYPDLNAQVMNTTPMKGVYEVKVADSIIYTDETGQYFLVGNLIDFKNQINLTKQREQELHKIDIQQLPLNHAIKSVKGNGQRTIYLFSDPDCPYCKVLEKELEKLNNITVYIFPYPNSSLHPNAENISKKIWCSAKPEQAWKNYLIENKQPSGKNNCDNPINQNIQLGQQLNINGTPTFFLKNGYRFSGAYSAEELEKILNSSTSN